METDQSSDIEQSRVDTYLNKYYGETNGMGLSDKRRLYESMHDSAYHILSVNGTDTRGMDPLHVETLGSDFQFGDRRQAELQLAAYERTRRAMGGITRNVPFDALINLESYVNRVNDTVTDPSDMVVAEYGPDALKGLSREEVVSMAADLKKDASLIVEAYRIVTDAVQKKIVDPSSINWNNPAAIKDLARKLQEQRT